MHDVNTLPERLGNIYACTQRPRHMSSVINNYEIQHENKIDGVIAITSEIFQDVNGFSNEYWGW